MPKLANNPPRWITATGFVLALIGVAMLIGLLHRFNAFLPGLLVLAGALCLSSNPRAPAKDDTHRPKMLPSYMAAGAMTGVGLAAFVMSFAWPGLAALRWPGLAIGALGAVLLARLVRRIRAHA